MVYGTYNYSYWGESKPTNITGGPHIVWFTIDISISRAERSGISSKKNNVTKTRAMARRLSQTPARLNVYESPCWWLRKKGTGMIADFEMFSGNP